MAKIPCDPLKFGKNVPNVTNFKQPHFLNYFYNFDEIQLM